MLHRKQQTKDSKFTAARNLSTPRWLVFPRVPHPARRTNGGVHLTVPGHKHGHKFFVADLTPRAWPTVNFSTPFHFPSHFSHLSSPSCLSPVRGPTRYFFNQRSKKSFYESIHSRGRPQPQSWSFLPKDTIVKVLIQSLVSPHCHIASLFFTDISGILIISYHIILHNYYYRYRLILNFITLI